MAKKSRAERRAETIEMAIASARAVANSDEAIELSKKSHGKRGTWTKEDEELLRKGMIRIPMDRGNPSMYYLRGTESQGEEEEEEDAQ